MIALLLLLSVQIGPTAPETPNRQPQLAARGNNVAVAYGAGNAIYFAASADGGTTFGTPVMVSSHGELALGMHRGPRVAYTPRGIVISAVVGQQGKGKDGDVLAWRSQDGGKTWSEPVQIYGSVSRDGGATWSENRLVYGSPSGTVCQCCHPYAAG